MAIGSFKLSGLARVTLLPAADFSDAATGTYTDDGIDYKYITYTASGTLTVTENGRASVFILAGGGGSPGSGAGAGGLIEDEVFLTSDTYNITVGAGGAASSNGSDSKFGRGKNTTLYAVGGGAGVIAWQNGIAGGCGGGAANTVGGAVLYEQGNAGGGSGVGTYSGGGGQGAAGAAGGDGGAGISSTFTGSAVSRAAGGRGVSGSADGTFWTGAANSGDGGRYVSVSAAGHSGVVIVRVRT